jgi:hypothetical protein
VWCYLDWVYDLEPVELALLELVAAHPGVIGGDIPRVELLAACELPLAEFVRRLAYLKEIGFVTVLESSPDRDVVLTGEGRAHLEAERDAGMRVNRAPRLRQSGLSE